MTEKPQAPSKDSFKRDEPVVIPLDPEVALRALLAVRPDDESTDGDESESGGADDK